jgi:hypothetical protein
MTTKTKTTTPPAPEASRPPCLCGCGETPKGRRARFLPGHDARYHASLRAEPEFVVTDEWNLPTDPDGLLKWLKEADVTLAAFRQMPVWANAPADLVAALALPTAPVPVKAPTPPRSPARRRTVKGGTPETVGSDS